MGQALMEMMPDPTRILGANPSDKAIDQEARRVLAESGLDVDAVYAIGNSIWMMAAQMQQEPEATVVGAFVTGCAMTCLLNKRGALT